MTNTIINLKYSAGELYEPINYRDAYAVWMPRIGRVVFWAMAVGIVFDILKLNHII